MRYTYVTMLYSDNFLPGLLVLHHSLKKAHSKYPLLVLVTANVSKDIIFMITSLGMQTERFDFIVNPDATKPARFREMYSKLYIFGMEHYDKIVYIDSDMLVCANIDILFSKKHLSAANSGGMLPEHTDWKDLNAGLLVVVPNRATLNDMLSKIDSVTSSDGGDQGFLHSYYPNWRMEEELHLDHGYNMFPAILERYHELFGYTIATPLDDPSTERLVRVIHFCGPTKPWDKRFDYKNCLGMNRITIDLWRNCLHDFLSLLPINAVRFFHTYGVQDFVKDEELIV